MARGFTKDDKFHPIENDSPRMPKDIEIDMLAKNNGEAIAVSTGPKEKSGIEAFRVKTLPDPYVNDKDDINGFFNSRTHHVGLDENKKDNTHYIHGQSEGNEDRWYNKDAYTNIKEKGFLTTKTIVGLPNETLLVGKDGTVTTVYAEKMMLPEDDMSSSEDPLGGYYRIYNGKVDAGGIDKEIEKEYYRNKHALR